MNFIAVLIALEVILVAYIVSRLVRYKATPNPTLRAATLTAIALLLAMLSVTEPVEVHLRGPNGVTVGVPTLIKHLGILGCGAGVLLMALAQRRIQRVWAETLVWLWFSVSAVAVIVLHLLAGGGGHQTSIDYVEWSHSQPLLLAAMMITYVGGLFASVGIVAVIWPLHLRSPAGRGLAIMATGALLFAAWCVLRMAYLREAAVAAVPPVGTDLRLTQELSLVGLLLLTVGLVWSTAEADLAAVYHWHRFRRLSSRVLEVIPEVRRKSDHRLGFDTWVSDRAVEVLDGLHQIENIAGRESGFPRAPDSVSSGEVTAVAADLGDEHRNRGRSKA